MGSIGRRSILKAGLPAVALAGVGSAGGAGEAAAAGEPRNPALGGAGAGAFKLGLVTYNLGKDMDLAALIDACEQTGFEAVELRTTHKHGVEPTLDKAQRQAVKQRFAGRKVRLLSLGSACEYHAPDPAVVKKNVEETKRFVELAHDIGALGVKVRPNGIPAEVPEERTLDQIGKALRECGQFARERGVEIWLEVHGKSSQEPRRIHRMMQAADHPHVGVCWNSNPTDVESGSVKKSFDLLKPWLRSAHINELWKKEYPWRELFGLMKQAGYNRYTLAECPESSDPVRVMRFYRALWGEFQRA